MSEPDHDAVTSVSIFGRSYQLRGNEDGKYLVDLAALVDGKMRERAGEYAPSPQQYDLERPSIAFTDVGGMDSVKESLASVRTKPSKSKRTMPSTSLLAKRNTQRAL